MITEVLQLQLWDGVYSHNFPVVNGVKQGGRGIEGILSPVLFWIYIDDLLLTLRQTGVGCFLGIVGALAIGGGRSQWLGGHHSEPFPSPPFPLFPFLPFPLSLPLPISFPSLPSLPSNVEVGPLPPTFLPSPSFSLPYPSVPSPFPSTLLLPLISKLLKSS